MTRTEYLKQYSPASDAERTALHRAYYGGLVELLGEKALRGLLPCSRERAIEALAQDPHLNNIELGLWDAQHANVLALVRAADPEEIRRLTCTAVYGWSLGDTVCVLKEAAKRWTEEPEEASLPELRLCSFCGEEIRSEPDKNISLGDAAYDHLQYKCTEDQTADDGGGYDWRSYTEEELLEWTDEPGEETVYLVDVVRYTPTIKCFEVKGRTATEAKKNALEAAKESSDSGDPNWDECVQENRYEARPCTVKEGASCQQTPKT